MDISPIVSGDVSSPASSRLKDIVHAFLHFVHEIMIGTRKETIDSSAGHTGDHQVAHPARSERLVTDRGACQIREAKINPYVAALGRARQRLRDVGISQRALERKLRDDRKGRLGARRLARRTMSEAVSAVTSTFSPS